MPILLSMAVTVVGLVPLMATAQVDQTPTSPTAPSAHSPAPRYESVFHNYRPYMEPEQVPSVVWRAANDEMVRLGGHMGHLRDARPAEPAGQSDAASKRAPAAHRGHGGK